MTRRTFVQVPTFVMELACSGAISPRAYLLYSVLRSHRNNENQAAWASNAKLAEEMGMSHRQNIPRLMRELVESGAVTKQNRSGTSNWYTFPETASVITSDDTTVITADYTEEASVITSDSPPESPVITPRNHPVYPPVITGDVLTRSTELDRKTREIERLSDDSRPRQKAATAAGAGLSRIEAHASLSRLPRPPIGRDRHEAIMWLNECLRIEFGAEPLNVAQEGLITEQLNVRQMPLPAILSFWRERTEERISA